MFKTPFTLSREAPAPYVRLAELKPNGEVLARLGAVMGKPLPGKGVWACVVLGAD